MKGREKRIIELGFGVSLKAIESKFFSGDTYPDYEIVNKEVIKK